MHKNDVSLDSCCAFIVNVAEFKTNLAVTLLLPAWPIFFPEPFSGMIFSIHLTPGKTGLESGQRKIAKWMC